MRCIARSPRRRSPSTAGIPPPRFAAPWPRPWLPGRARCTSRCRAMSQRCRSRRPKTRRAFQSIRRRLRRPRPRESPLSPRPSLRHRRPVVVLGLDLHPRDHRGAGAGVRRASRRAGVRHAEGQGDAAGGSSAVLRRLRRRRRRQRDHGALRARRSHHRHRLRAGRVRQAVAPHDEAGVDESGDDRGGRLSPARRSRRRPAADALRYRRAIAGAVRVDGGRAADVSRRPPRACSNLRRRPTVCPATS